MLAQKDSSTLPGWRDFERSVALAFGGQAQESKAIFDVLSAGGIAAGIAALSITPALALAIYGWVLSVNIDKVNWSQGVCIQGNWPVINGPGAFIWAVAGS